MSEAAYINEAARWADWLTKSEANNSRDVQRAWERLEERYGLPSQVFWALRYRKPKTLLVSIYMRLKAAHDAEKARQFRRYEHELQIASQLGAAEADVSPTPALVPDPEAPF